MTETADQRRKARRFQMELPVEVNLPSDTGLEATTAHTRDVSFRGLFFTMDEAPALGSPIDFVLTLPKEVTQSSDVRIRCVGRVVRVESGSEGQVEEKHSIGVAAVIEHYSFLPGEAPQSSS